MTKNYRFAQDPERDDDWKISATKLLVTERERLLWRAQGLPADTSSLVAASRVLKGPLIPIFLDPSGVAVSWIKRSFASKLEITQPEDSKFLTTLELAVRFGKVLLVEELVEFPSILLPVIRQRPLRLGDRILPAQQGFQLLLATRKNRLEDIPKEADAILCKITLGTGTKSLAERFVEKVRANEFIV
jgi:dynein heavy chain 2